MLFDRVICDLSFKYNIGKPSVQTNIRKNMPDDVEDMVEIVKKHFGFLLYLKGFEIKNAKREIYQVFSVVLEGDFLICVSSDRDGYIDVTFAPVNTPINEWWKWSRLQVVVYYLTNNLNYIGHYDGERNLNNELEWLSGFVAEYFTLILDLYTGKQIEQYQIKIDSLNKEIDHLEIKNYSTKKLGK